jgi:hypothetical protein
MTFLNILGSVILSGVRELDMTLKDKFKAEKPWAVLGWTRKQWKSIRPWKKANMSEARYAEMLRALDQEMIKDIKDHAMAEMLVDEIFKSEE